MGNYDRGDRGGDRGGRSFGGDRGGRGGFGGRRSFGDRPRPSFGGRGGFGGNRDGGDRTMFKTVCSNCGKECEVPFRPTTGKPVYCSDCFEKMGGRESSQRPERSEFRAPKPAFNDTKIELEALNDKLDKILKLLEPKVEKAVIETVPEEVKALNVKKATKKSAPKK